MLRVGLTGELGSGKSTVARLLAGHGAVVLSSDEMGRALMQPGQAVFRAIVEHFGPTVLAGDGTLDRPTLAALAFDPAHPRVEELNALVHPAVLAAQEQQIAAIAQKQPNAIVVVESALLLTTKYVSGNQPASDTSWRSRFDLVVLVTAPEEVKVDRFIQRASAGRPLSESERAKLRADAQARLAAQHTSPNEPSGVYRLHNDGDLSALRGQVERLWFQLRQERTAEPPAMSA